jgi:hypothetical protein
MAMNVVFLESEFEANVMCNGVSCYDLTTARSKLERYLIELMSRFDVMVDLCWAMLFRCVLKSSVHRVARESHYSTFIML